MPSNLTKHQPAIPRTPAAAKRLGYKKQSEMRDPLKDLSNDAKGRMVMVDLHPQNGRPTRYCHFDRDKGMWVCSDSGTPEGD